MDYKYWIKSYILTKLGYNMTIKYTDWSPDTCDCNIRYSWDDSVPDNQRVHSVTVIGKSCQAHKPLLPNQVVTYNTVLDENQKKNQTLQLALDNLTNDLGDSITDENGGNYIVLKPHIIFTYSFSGTAPNRVLTVSFLNANLTQQKKNTLQTFLNNKFGNGVVVIQ